MSQLWVLKTKGDKAAFGGNTGYNDSLTSHYVYDTTVPNHGKVQKDDYVVITNKHFILGFARIESIKIKYQTAKIRYSCPKCGTTEFYIRKGVNPPFKCRKKHLFYKRKERKIIVDTYKAIYKKSFITCQPLKKVELLASYFIKKNSYFSIQAADVHFLKENIPKILSSDLRNQLPRKQLWGKKDGKFVLPYTPNFNDDRQTKMRKVISRDGQAKFKNELIEYYGPTCMISNVFTPFAIQASHIWPYKGTKENNPRNGLLLRADLHILYDSDLIGINPTDLSIKLHPSISNSYYNRYDGKKIKAEGKNMTPSIDALTLRWKQFKSKLKS